MISPLSLFPKTQFFFFFQNMPQFRTATNVRIILPPSLNTPSALEASSVWQQSSRSVVINILSSPSVAKPFTKPLDHRHRPPPDSGRDETDVKKLFNPPPPQNSQNPVFLQSASSASSSPIRVFSEQSSLSP